jgi:predicted helicase
MTIQQYLDKVNILFKTGNAREHSYRGDLQNLIMAILPDILVTNEPARVACGAPDYVLTRKDIPVGYIEAKDIGVDLGSKTLKEQFDRYKSGLSNLIFTDYMDFHFYKDGELTTTIAIAKLECGVIIPLPQHFEQFKGLIENFAVTVSQTIKSPSKLAEMMAGKARLMADVIEKSLNKDDELEYKSNIKSQMLSFQSLLIHDIDNKGFSDIYSQTIAYGMFAARYHDPTLDDFSRTEAAQLIPKSNPFLRKLFHDIAGYDLDDRLVWIVDELVNIFLASDVADIMKNFGKSTKQEDPIVHFYETFLGEYNPALRKAKGVWYTPQPVVNFIVRGVDDILKAEFKLPQGLADTSKIKVKAKTDVADKRTASGYREYEKEVHKVQILDPATGTGTFLAEVVRHIYKKFEGQQGIWGKYVKNDLIPRLNGFEILMASYAMAHLKMDMLLTETGYNVDDDQRFRIFLTNTLEEAHPDSGTLFSSWLSDEASQANVVKQDTPVMVVLGNPPYNGMSKNQGDWIMDLMKAYKLEPGGKERLNERNPKMINDDYVKFIRQSQYFIEQNGEGVLAFINPHGFLDSDTFRGVRWNLLKSFDKIYSIDLQGNTKKKLVSNEGVKDENVFDITQGVSINIFVKTSKKESLGEVFYHGIIGKRNTKYDFLNNNSLSSINFENIKYKEPNYFFVPKDFEKLEAYEKFISIRELFKFSSTGMQSDKDKFCVQMTTNDIEEVYDALNNEDETFVREKFDLGKDSSSWNLDGAKKDIQSNITSKIDFSKVLYRPFDTRYTYYTGNSNGFMGRPRKDLIKHIEKKDNISLITIKNSRSSDAWNLIFLSKLICTKPTSITSLDANYVFPLYLYSDNEGTIAIDDIQRIPNLDLDIVSSIVEKLKIEFVPEKLVSRSSFAPIDLLDYIYAVLHNGNFRNEYEELLNIDFPRIPFPIDTNKFWELVDLGSELRGIHLLESSKLDNYISQYPKDGDNVIENVVFKNENVFINETQHFANIPKVIWEFRIGGYQPAQKWLKDRKGRELNFEDILHYQKVIVALSETERIMKEINKIKI